MENDYLTEKVSVNLNTSTLSDIDLLVDNGYFSNRSDFINQAVREAIHARRQTIERVIDRQTADNGEGRHWFIGLSGLEKRELEALKAKNKTTAVTGYGVLTIADGIEDQLVFDTVESIRVKGRVICSAAVKAHYGIKK